LQCTGLVLAIALIDEAIPCTPPSIDITYAAHTASCTFLLDSEGICRRIVVAPKGKRSAGRTAARCVGAQYVASLDGSAAGGLVEMPRVGAAMLFARVDERGRVSLVRTGVVLSFESNAGEDPFADSGTVETSAPELETPRMERAIPSAASRAIDHDYYDDSSEKTQRIQALRPEDIAAALGERERERDEDQDLGNDLATAEYRTVIDDSAPRPTLPSTQALPGVLTLRNPHRDTTVEDDDAYARPKVPTPSTPPRGVLPRRSDPRMRAAAARAYAPGPAPGPAPRAYSSDIQVSRRRRGT
ncbi:MAG: hypothetical protein JWO86_972, partial [Myxococcaceae bacterium]|nr:hypothetical protein [Myxococcaceae bacterium]